MERGTKTGPQHAGLAAAERGCLVIADISGYTTYLHATELEHAQDVLGDLMETVVGSLQPVLRLSKLEGDAAFAYVLAGEFEASMLLDTVDGAYFAFRARLRDIRQATTCECNACVLIPSLDLKLVVHDGRFVRRRVAGGEELAGSDVILVHRLLKNRAAELVGGRAYTLYTAACVETLGIDPAVLGLREHVEHYEDVGEVRCFVEDLEARWEYELERRRVYVLADDALFEVSFRVPASPPLAWEWITSPAKRPLWQQGVLRVDSEAPGGRRGVGTTNHCVHGGSETLEEILDWRPYRYFTTAYTFPGIGKWPWTCELDPDGDGTRVSMRGSALAGRKKLVGLLMRRKIVKTLTAHGAGLASVLAVETSASEPPAGVVATPAAS